MWVKNVTIAQAAVIPVFIIALPCMVLQKMAADNSAIPKDNRRLWN